MLLFLPFGIPYPLLRPVGFDGHTKSKSGSFLKHLSISTPLKNATDLKQKNGKNNLKKKFFFQNKFSCYAILTIGKSSNPSLYENMALVNKLVNCKARAARYLSSIIKISTV